jgi:sugar/nucleoside kinase (ribokinase family)
MVSGILDRRKREFGEKVETPLFVWEPVPDLCTPEELENCRDALKVVDYVSPNHEEMSGFYGVSANCGEHVDRELIEQCAVDWSFNRKEGGKLKAVVVRAGKDGCLVATKESMTTRWIPAYHQNSDKVIDPTGGGNAFLGGLTIGLARGATVEEAAILGSVAASFAIEQVGVPKLTVDVNDERWNGERVQDRLERFMERL